MKLNDRIQCQICCRYFGSLVNHLRTHDMTPAQYKETYGVHKVVAETVRLRLGKLAVGRGWGKVAWTDERILRGIRRIARSGAPLAASRVKRAHLHLFSIAVQRFGSWEVASRTAGLDYDQVRIMRPEWTEATILEEIRARRQVGRSLSFVGMLTEDPCLFDAASKRFRGWRRAVEAAGINYDEVRYRKTDSAAKGEEALAAVKAFLKERGPVPVETVAAERPDLFQLAKYWLGGWRAALKRLQVRYPGGGMGPPRKWTQEAIAAEIRRRVDAGLSVRAGDVLREQPSFFQRARRRLGGDWGAVLKLAGLDPALYTPRRWTPEKVIDGLRAWVAAGKPLYSNEVAKEDQGLVMAAQVQFGGWRKAVAAAGLQVPPKRWRPPRWTKEEMLEMLREDQRKGLSMFAADLELRRPSLYSSLLAHYPGGRKGALRDLGLGEDPAFVGRRSKWTRETILEAIRTLYAEGKSLRPSDLHDTMSGLVHAAHLRALGTWRDAVREAGIDPNQVLGWRTWTADEVLEAIREMIRAGKSLRHKDVMVEAEGGKLYQAARRYFASWEEAVRRARG